MTVRDEIFARLSSGSTTLAALIGTRVYRTKLPQNPTLPAVTYWKVSGNRLHDLTGPTGQSDPRFQVSCWARTSATAEDVAEAVRVRLDGWTSTGGVQVAELVNETDLYDDEVEIYHVALDFVLMHDE